LDIDIDITPAFKPETVFPKWVRASVLRDDSLSAHPCGVYPQAIARDPITSLAAIPYEQAEDLGFLKVDFLHLNFYGNFKTRQEIDDLLKVEPDWTLLQLPSAQKKLFQLAKHGDLLSDLKPRSLTDLADCMALIRPGKKALIPLYRKEKVACRRGLFARDETGYSFKLSHALAYSMVVWLQLHLIAQGRL
jgi:DNA polymerase III alpha subunit